MMAMYYRNGSYFSEATIVEIDGMRYLLGAMTAEQRSAAGYADVDIPLRPDMDAVAIVTEVRNGPNIVYDVVPRPLEQVKDFKKAQIAAHRYQVEVGGCVLPDGTSIATDDRSKTLLYGAHLIAKMGDPNATVKFKTSAGFVDLSNADLIAHAEAVAAHVQAAFNAEAVHCAAVDDMQDREDDPLAARLAIIEYDHTSGW